MGGYQNPCPPRFQNPGGKTCPPDFESLGGESIAGYGNLAEQKRWGDTKEARGILKNEGYPPGIPPQWGDTAFKLGGILDFSILVSPQISEAWGVIFSVPPDFRRQGGNSKWYPPTLWGDTRIYVLGQSDVITRVNLQSSEDPKVNPKKGSQAKNMRKSL